MGGAIHNCQLHGKQVVCTAMAGEYYMRWKRIAVPVDLILVDYLSNSAVCSVSQ